MLEESQYMNTAWMRRKRRYSEAASRGSLPGDLEPAPKTLLTEGKWIVMGKTARGINLIKFLIH